MKRLDDLYRLVAGLAEACEDEMETMREVLDQLIQQAEEVGSEVEDLASMMNAVLSAATAAVQSTAVEIGHAKDCMERGQEETARQWLSAAAVSIDTAAKALKEMQQ